MKIFLSWSGERSKQAALAFYYWITDVVQRVEPWMSTEDIESGAGWNQRIRDNLQLSNYGIVFVTKDNLTKPWLMFESGALAKHVLESRVVPLIIDADLKAEHLPGPLLQLQARPGSKENVFRLISDINDSTEKPINEDSLKRCFEVHWERLELGWKKLPKSESNLPEVSDRATVSKLLSLMSSISNRLSSVEDTLNKVHRNEVNDTVHQDFGPTEEQRRILISNLNTYRNLTVSEKKKIVEAFSRLIKRGHSRVRTPFKGFDVEIDSQGEIKIWPKGEVELEP